MKRVTLTFALLAFWACGGKAVIDEPLGAGGASSNTTTTGNPTGASPLCATPDPVGVQTMCGGSAAVGTGGGVACLSAVCDEDGNMWESSCEGNACVCSYNFDVRCTCIIDNGSFCSSGIPSCCPAPFPG